MVCCERYSNTQRERASQDDLALLLLHVWTSDIERRRGGAEEGACGIEMGVL
jgi:hypothetical protein